MQMGVNKNHAERQTTAEEHYFQKFLSKLQDPSITDPITPKLSVTGMPSPPDRIATRNNRQIGIELCEYFVDLNSPDQVEGSPLRREESEFNRIIETAKTKFERQSSRQLRVDFSKNSSWKFTNENDRNLKREIVDRIVTMINTIYSGQGVAALSWHQLSVFNLQDVFQSVWIEDYHSKYPSLWAMNGGGGIPTVLHENLDVRVQEKNNKLSGYLRYCDECWLLIYTTGGGMSSWVHISDSRETIETYKFESSFSRLFFLEGFTGELIELQTTG
ncbi:MAG TPA: hypothetical protein VFO76_12860 [Candidatus Kapabacteria bacterium]|nr:hypothetical protein [Candidatus Kapabacteria bacterium]